MNKGRSVYSVHIDIEDLKRSLEHAGYEANDGRIQRLADRFGSMLANFDGYVPEVVSDIVSDMVQDEELPVNPDFDA